MAQPIFHSQYTAAQIEALLEHGTPIILSGNWWTWDIEDGEYKDTGKSAEGATAWHGVADDFSASVDYSVGDYVLYNGDLYVFTSDHAAGAWDASDVSACTVADALAANKPSELNRRILAAYPTDIISNAGIASFSDGADNIPIKKLSVSITPVQDLHGYDNPWPGGGGKNLLPTTLANLKSWNTAGTWSDNVYTYNGVDYTVHVDEAGNVRWIKIDGDADGDSVFVLSGALSFAEATILSGCPLGGIGFASLQAEGGSTYQDTGTGVTIPANESITRTVISVPNGYGLTKTVTPMIRLATVSDATFAPYTNTCPISGWDAVNLYHTGINLWDEQWELGAYSTVDGSKVASNTSIRSKNLIPIPLATGERLYICSPVPIRVFYWKDKDTCTGYGTINNDVIGLGFHSFVSFDVPDTTTYGNNISINYPSSDHNYHAYTSGSPQEIDLPSTTYGGTLTIHEDGSGVLTTTMGIADLGDATWQRTSNGRYMYTNYISSSVKPPSTNNTLVIAVCTNLALDTAANVDSDSDAAIFGVVSNGNIRAKYPGFPSNPTTFKASVSGWKVVYELASPVVTTLTASQVKTLLDNNIWADTGDVVELIYRADPTLFINGKISALTAIISGT